MAFNINAQIILSQPKNLNNVTKQISKQLGKVAKIDLKIGNTQQLTNLNKQLTTLNNSFNKLNFNANLNNVFRSRARLTLDRPELSEQDRIDNIHVDYKIPHLVLIYYVNTVDGDTLIYEDNKIIERVSPKRGRCLLFNGSLQHTSTSPALGPRIIINNNIR